MKMKTKRGCSFNFQINRVLILEIVLFRLEGNAETFSWGKRYFVDFLRRLIFLPSENCRQFSANTLNSGTVGERKSCTVVEAKLSSGNGGNACLPTSGINSSFSLTKGITSCSG